MAFLGQDDKELDPNNPNGQATQSGTPMQNTGESSFASSGGDPVSTAGVGAGGTGGWTNIQSYLNANKDNHGSSQLLQNTVGGSLDQEEKNFNNQKSQALDSSNNLVKTVDIGQDDASKLISQAGSHYNYAGGSQNQTYQDATGRLKNAVQAQYSAPTSFNWAMDNQAKNYGDGLATDQGFTGLLNGLYQSKAPIGSGGLALQQQLDTNDSQLADARQALLNRYSGLTQAETQGTADTDQTLKNNAQAFQTKQSGLLSYLNGEESNDRNYIQKAADQFNTDESNIAAGAHGTENFTGTGVSGGANGPVRYQLDARIARDPFAAYHAGTAANLENVDGASNQRNQFNALADILGLSDRINQSNSTAQHGSVDFNQAAYNAAKQADLNRPDLYKFDPFLNRYIYIGNGKTS